MALSIKTTLLSVYDKTGIVDFARGLRELGVELMSTGGTGKLLSEKGIAVRDIADYTGFPEILDGRVKSLHPKIHAGLLFRRGIANDRETIDKLGIMPIDMVVVNLYPFEKVAAQSPSLDNALENIDIGGPTMIRAAAKNYQSVAVVTDPADYLQVLAELRGNNGNLSEKTSSQLMLKAFERTAAYDAAISSFFQTRARNGVRSEWPAPRSLVLNFEKIHDLRYGENPHQKAAVYRNRYENDCIASSLMVAGEKELSYTNILDADAAYSLVAELGGIVATAIIKHTNPCGVGKGKTLAESCRKALETDPVSSFGGVYSFTRPVDIETANLLSDKFVELVLAPGFEDEALRVLSAKKNRRILDISGQLNANRKESGTQKNFRWIHGGILYQDQDEQLIDEQNRKTVTKRQPTPSELDALLFAWKIVKHVKSNAIVLSTPEQLVGVGAGQMSRVDSCKIALMKAQDAGLNVKGTVMASDAFLPFRDSVDLMGKAGVTAIIQPGGSIRDPEVIRAADEFGMAMQFTGIRHFAH
ncbi:MAG: bifunctional phosphoribosylaminoimidazolecarboxamide formyltransferase/IMP cyclohydrolase [Candidatus Bathyarchaeia archaeon]